MTIASLRDWCDLRSKVMRRKGGSTLPHSLLGMEFISSLWWRPFSGKVLLSFDISMAYSAASTILISNLMRASKSKCKVVQKAIELIIPQQVCSSSSLCWLWLNLFKLLLFVTFLCFCTLVLLPNVMSHAHWFIKKPHSVWCTNVLPSWWFYFCVVKSAPPLRPLISLVISLARSNYKCIYLPSRINLVI